MLVQPISDKQNFNGQVIVLGKISTTQNHLFNLHKANLVQMIKDKPYDLFVRQSNSKKTIKLMTEKDAKTGYFVRKNKQNFEECAQFAINDKDKKLEIERQNKEKEARKQAEAFYLYQKERLIRSLF